MENLLPKGFIYRPGRKEDVEAAVEMFNIDASWLGSRNLSFRR